MTEIGLTAGAEREWERTHSRSILAGYSPEILFDAAVVVVGAGALGQNVVQDLALAGVGRLAIIDFDEFEAHNATRSPLYPDQSAAERLGAGKAANVAGRVRAAATAPSPDVRFFHGTVQEVAHPFMASADVIVSAVDSQAARSYLSELGRILRVPVVEGGFAAQQFSMSIDLSDWSTACYRCSNPIEEGSFSCTQYALEAERNDVIPAIQNAAAVLGGLMSETIIQILHKTFEQSSHNKVVGDIGAPSLRKVVVSHSDDCPGVHGELIVERPLRLAKLRFGDLASALEDTEYSALRLLDPFVVEMSCQSCGAHLRPLAPQSVWSRKPYCISCDPSSPHQASNEIPFLPLEYRLFESSEIEALGLEDVDLDRAGLGHRSRLLLVGRQGGLATGLIEHLTLVDDGESDRWDVPSLVQVELNDGKGWR
jgi:adenylyltransferase/sulfurtransferase